MRAIRPTCAIAALAIAVFTTTFSGQPRAQQPVIAPQAAVPIDDKAIGGVVTSRFGPEAGVWVIVETRDLGTRFAKMAVTDERRRYVIPDLPQAKYRVWMPGHAV